MTHISEIKPDRANANKGSERGRVQIEQSLREFGFADAGTLDRNNVIIGGNKRTEVAAEIGMEDVLIVDVDGTKPVFIRRNDLDLDSPDDDRARRLAYALNRSQEVSLTWDAEQLLADMTAGLPLEDFWRQDELDELLAEIMPKPEAKDAGPQIDRAEELRQQWGTELGQLWQLGDHRLICGDCTDPATVARVMGGERAELIWTDPPYGVAVGDKNKYLNSIARSNRVEENLQNDTLDEPHLTQMLCVAFDNALSVCLDGGAWYVAAPAGPLHVLFGQALKERGIWHQTIQWVKNNATFSPMGVDYHWQSEPIFYGWKPGAGHRYYGGRQQTTVWEIARPLASPEHPTMKPVELVARAIENSSRSKEIIFDPFSGSGTTGIACESLGRQARMIELSPAYCAVILQRWSDATNGQTPVLLES